MTALEKASGKLGAEMRALCLAARAAAATLAGAKPEQRSEALKQSAAAIRARHAAILEANYRDLELAQNDKPKPAMTDRLMLDDRRIEAMAHGLDELAAFPDPVGTVLAEWTRPNGLHISRVRVPLGVIGIIYESRPNVTADAGGLCIRSGNAVSCAAARKAFTPRAPSAMRWSRVSSRWACQRRRCSWCRPARARRGGTCSP